MVSSDLRGDVLAQMHERQEAVMVELRAEAVEREAQADELCMAVPKELVPLVLSGLAGWSPGAWDGLPGELLAIDDISMYAIRGQGDDEHYVIVRWSVPRWASSYGGLALLVTGPLEEPDSIQWRLLGLGPGASHDYPNPTFFEPVVRTDSLRQPFGGCASTGPGSGPFHTSELGGCEGSTEPWCEEPALNPIWAPGEPLPATIDAGLTWSITLDNDLHPDAHGRHVKLTREYGVSTPTWTYVDGQLWDHNEDIQWNHNQHVPEVVAQQRSMTCDQLHAEHTDWMDVVASIEARSSIFDIHLGFQAMAYAQNATNLSAESGCDSP
jgi:hypothetical protein